VGIAARLARPIILSGPVSYAAKVIFLAAAYFAAAKLALLVAIPPGYATAVWPPSGIALAAVLLLGNRIWPGIWLGATLVIVTVESSLLAAVLIGTGNTLEALAGAALVRTFIGVHRTFQRGEDVAKFVAIAAVSSAIAATVAVVPLTLVDALSSPDLLWNWWTWWQGNATGIIIVAPLVLGWSARDKETWSRSRILEAASLALPLLVFTHAIFSGRFMEQHTFAILPFIIWAAFRFRQREVATLNAAVCAIAVWFTLEGRGPSAGTTLNASLLQLLAFMSIVVATGLVINAVVGERKRAIEALGRALGDLREQAIRDPLTSLYNRRFLGDYLPRELMRAKREGTPLAAIMIDLDRFKLINDTAGHSAGDLVLREIATLLTSHIRGSDIACRYGGEEFALILPNATSDSARRRSEEICSAIRQGNDTLRGVTASIGVARFPDHAADADSLLHAADDALYDAKHGGRDQVRIFPGGTATRPRAPGRDRQLRSAAAAS
jgi:diguanylate cyclase (GGDEF)-like protein